MSREVRPFAASGCAFEFPAKDYQAFVGRTIASIAQCVDEGVRLTFTDGSSLQVAFSSGYGEITSKGIEHKANPTEAHPPRDQHTDVSGPVYGGSYGD